MTMQSTTATRTQVNQNANVVALLNDVSLSDSFRNAAIIYNDSIANLFVTCGTEPGDATDYTVQIAPGASWPLPPGFRGPVWGVWASAGGGAARITVFQ